MAGARRFRDLVCYQLARELRKEIASIIEEPGVARDFELCDQLRRASRSATGNIAEGFACPTHREFARFLDMSLRSIREIEDRLLEISDRQLLTEAETASACNLAKRTAVATTRLRKYLRG